jgi:L-amino acid N-acyltransferase YncA
MKQLETVSEKSNSLREKFFPFKFGDYSIEPCTREECLNSSSKLFSKVFTSNPKGYVMKPDSKEAKDLMACRNEYRKIHAEYFLFFYKGKAIGWFMGEMEDFETFYMRNTGILPAHQGKGLYGAFLDRFITYITKLGYQRISSQHAPKNINVYKVKMARGFLVAGTENHERWGTLIKLVKILNPKREAYYLKKFG